MKEGERLSDEYGNIEAQVCRCVGPTCSGCEKSVKRHASKDFLEGWKARGEKDAEIVEGYTHKASAIAKAIREAE